MNQPNLYVSGIVQLPNALAFANPVKQVELALQWVRRFAEDLEIEVHQTRWLRWRVGKPWEFAARTWRPLQSSDDLPAGWEESLRQGQLRWGENTVLIPIPLGAEDTLTKRRAEELIVLRVAKLEPGKGRQLAAELRHPVHLLGWLRRLEDARRLDGIVRRVSVAPRRPRRPIDLCYQVASHILKAVHYEGACLVLRAQPNTDGLELLARVAEPRDKKRVEKHVLWPHATNAELNALGNRYVWLVCRERQPQVELYEIQTTQSAAGEMYALVEVGEAIQAQWRDTITELVISLEDAQLTEPSQVLLIQPVAGPTGFLGFVITATSGTDAFSAREALHAWEIGLHAAPALIRAGRLEADFSLVDTALREAASMTESPVEHAVELQAVFALLCDRLCSVLQAAGVAILPFDRRRGEILAQAGGQSGLRLQPHPRLAAQLMSWDAEVDWIEWSSSAEAPLPTLVTYPLDLRVRRLGAQILRSPSRRAIGILVALWDEDEARRGTDGTAASSPRPFPEVERKRIADFGRIAAGFLTRQFRLSTDSRLHTFLFDLYGQLLAGTSEEHAEDPSHLQALRDRLLKSILQEAMQSVGGHLGLVSVPSLRHEGLDVVVTIGRDDRLGQPIPLGEGSTGRCAQLRTTVMVASSEDPPPGVAPLHYGMDVKSEIAFPILSPSARLDAVITLENTQAHHSFSNEDLPLLQRLGQAAVVVLQHINQLLLQQSLGFISSKLDQGLEESPYQMYDLVGTELAKVTGASSVSVRLPDRDRRFLTPQWRTGQAGNLDSKAMPIEEGAVGAAFRTRATVHHEDVNRLSTLDRMPYSASRTNTRSEVAVPLAYRGRLLGVLNLEHAQPHAFTGSVRYVEMMATQLAGAMYHRERHQRRLRQANDQLLAALLAYHLKVGHDWAKGVRELRDSLSKLGRQVDQIDGAAMARKIAALAEDADTSLKAKDNLLMAAARGFEPPEPVDVNKIILELHQVHRETPVHLDLCSERTTVLAGPTALAWVLREILENALKHGSERGSPAVAISTVVLQTGNRIEIRLDDNGPGFSEEGMENFGLKQIGGASARGSGLAMVGARLLLMSMDGELEAHNRPTNGGRVVVRLPIHQRETEAAP